MEPGAKRKQARLAGVARSSRAFFVSGSAVRENLPRISPASLAILFSPASVEWKVPPDASNTAGHNALAPYNSALLFNAKGERVFSYDKIHLVPFGEYEPFPLIHAVVNHVSDEVGGFRKGQTRSIAPLPGGFSLGVFICYEAIYPGEIRHFAADGANLLVNISNDGWFGRPPRRNNICSWPVSAPWKIAAG